MAPHSSTLAWKIPWTEEPGGLQSMGSLESERLSDFTFTFHFHALEKAMATHSSVLAWRILARGAWQATVHGITRVRHGLVTKPSPGSTSGKEPACQCRRRKRCGYDPSVGKIPLSRKRQPTPVSILAWRVPWTEEPGGLRSIGSQRIGHNTSNLAYTYASCL